MDREIEQINQECDAQKAKIIETINARSTIKINIGRYDTMLEQAEIRRSELNARFLRSKTDEETLDHQIRDAAAELDAASEKVRILENNKNDIRKHNIHENRIIDVNNDTSIFASLSLFFGPLIYFV